MHICKIVENWLLTLCMVQLGFHWMDFDELLYVSFSRNCQENSSFIEI